MSVLNKVHSKDLLNKLIHVGSESAEMSDDYQVGIHFKLTNPDSCSLRHLLPIEACDYHLVNLLHQSLDVCDDSFTVDLKKHL